MVSRVVLVLGDQLSPDLSALAQADRDTDLVVMAEVRQEATYAPHHPKKIAFLFAAMRKFAAQLQERGWQVAYTRLDDPDNTHSIAGELVRRAAAHGATEVLMTECGEWRLRAALADADSYGSHMKVIRFSDTRFIASQAEFDAWAEGRKQLRMEYFYREMRRKTGLLMDGDKPVGGQWNFDHDNRKPAKGKDLFASGPLRFDPDETVEEVLALVEREFPSNFGALRPFWFATDAAQAQASLDHFIAQRLETFGDYQDAMLRDDGFLSHAVLGLYINAGLLDPLKVCQAIENAYENGDAPINAVEGFIRQILGWREFVRGIYFHEGPDYTLRNALNHQRKLPQMYWGGETRMACMQAAIDQTRDEAYAHHIQRLMVTGNFALLAGVAPAEIHEWYLAVYADAFEWVEAPNVIGMSQFADGGVVGSKPYVSSGAYINRMSDYCKGCHYSVSAKTGEKACPFNLLYWHFLIRHRDRFEGNPRMAQMYRTWDRMDETRRDTVLSEAQQTLKDLSENKII
ncbi:cryptochrome/photolyase family protein [Meridianimarinicoccus roseus]|uniref:Cryptochrome/photolyase family protein n=1 Tax=Meridianimarinicoccus roseus TaxID=2072018 RepID=A0A2V2LIN0_9RHOB|nr:cryptochrome/photolyase family protein [Meridianimarinicoccus roseus]PWR02279.1 cryptochrome/photolyase family protein [Meridianimarinicoccus roseus]